MTKAGRFRARLLAVAMATLAGAATLPSSAHAQFFGDGWGFGRPSAPSRSYFPFSFFGRPPARPRPPVESYRAPPPRKLATQPTTTVVVIGDSMADWLAYGLEEIYADQPQIGIVRKIRLYSGLVHYEPRNDTLEWSQEIKDILAGEKPAAIVVMLGLNDRLPIRVPEPPQEDTQRAGKQAAQTGKQPTQPSAQGQNGKPAPGLYEFRTDEWAKLYTKRIDDMIDALKSKGVPVLWVGLPAIRGTRSTSDMSFLDNLYSAAADRSGIQYVDIWNGFVDENGRYTVEGPDFEGQTRRLRSGDGVHFTRYGALKLAHLVDQDLSPILSNPAAATPVPQASTPAKPGAARPAIGPVLPLTASDGDGELLGGGNDTLLGGSQKTSAELGPTAADVLVHGDALAAPANRADNFAWPPPAAAANAAPPARPAPPQSPERR